MAHHSLERSGFPGPKAVQGPGKEGGTWRVSEVNYTGSEI